MRARLHNGEKAAKEQTRLHNRRLVLQVIAGQGETSRAVIARSTMLTPPTVSSIVRELADEGFIEDRGRPDAGSIGKPPQLVAIAGGRYQTVCVDLSGPRFAGAVIDLNGSIVDTVKGESCDLIGDDALAAAEDLTRELVDGVDAAEARICVATPGVVDNDGVVRRASFFEWTNVPLARRLEDRFGVATHVVNDSHALALAEYARLPVPVENLVAVRVARGVSAGIILHGTPYVGDGFGAGEIGFLLPSAAGSDDLRHRSTVSVDWLVAQLGSPEARELDHAVAQARSQTVDDVATVIGDDLGGALAAIVGVLDIHTVRIDPALRCLGPGLLDAAARSLAQAVVDSIASEVDIRFGLAGPDAIVRGAAIAVTHRDLGLV